MKTTLDPITKQVIEIVVASLAVIDEKIIAQISEETTLEKLNPTINAIDFGEIMNGLEEKWGITDEIPENTRTVGDIVNFVKKHLN
jgi:acyl carrier protein